MKHHHRFEGPILWIAALVVGLGLGFALTRVLPPEYAATNSAAPGEASTHTAPTPADPDAHADPASTLQPTTPVQPGATSGHAPASAPAPLKPRIPLILCIPFALLLGCIALMPFVSMHFWHHHFPDISFFLGGTIAGYYLAAFNLPNFNHGLTYGQHSMLHAVIEYYSFIALVGGLFVVSGTILIELRGRATPGLNTGLLLFGALLANIVGTTGASMLLIRPFLRINEGRLRPIHVVLFIFIVSNCGGALTPIGDPPLYLGYLKGVPFAWTLQNLAGEWAFVVGLLLAVYYMIDRSIANKEEREFGQHAPAAADARASAGGPGRNPTNKAPFEDQHARFGFSIRGTVGIVCLALMVLGVFIDPIVKHFAATLPTLQGYPIGATFQLAVAAFAFALAPRAILDANHFSFFPVKEVGLLFLGIFLTMVPALGFLAANGSKLGVDSPTTFYFATGSLSAILDNAPTYLNFMQIAFGDSEITASTIRAWLQTREHVLDLRAISTAAVFFGAMTYIGNGPNFMVKSIAEASLVKMPSFFGYLGLALMILLPVLVANWALFFVVLR